MKGASDKVSCGMQERSIMDIWAEGFTLSLVILEGKTRH